MKAIIYSSFVLSIFAIILYLSRVGNTNSQYVSILVAVLAALVTFLVAWQIYNAFVTREEMNKFREEFSELKNHINKRISESEKSLVKRQDEGLILLRNLSFRNIDAVSTCLNLRDNHGVGATLEFIINNLEKFSNECDDGGFLWHTLYGWAEACVSDIVSALMYDKDDSLLRQCFEAIPHNKFCRLYNLRLSEDGWDAQRIAQFMFWLDIVSSRYPKPVTPEPPKE
ncbi:MAG: hypothetical protein K2K00_03730 [Muribaculaceae bacterium]|nr:hypothetical protein [Muribaculaceae bacterium]